VPDYDLLSPAVFLVPVCWMGAKDWQLLRSAKGNNEVIASSWRVDEANGMMEDAGPCAF